MKYKSVGIAALCLAAAMTLSACGGSSGSIRSADSIGSTGGTDTSLMEQAGILETSSLPDALALDASETESSAIFADAFSSRDLSGTWDEAGAVRIALNGASVSCDSSAVTVSGSTATITAAGTYVLSGTLENGTIIVDAGKGDKVQLVLNGVSIHSDTFAAIYVRQADKVFLTLADGTENTLSNGGTFTAIDSNDVDGVIFSKDDLTLNGTGRLVVTSPGKHGVVCKDDLTVTGGTYEITAASHALSGKDSVAIAGGAFTLTAGKDGVHSENSGDAERGSIYLAGGTLTIAADSDGLSASGMLQVDGGTLAVTADEGMEGTYIRINDGVINIYASDDGINAARKSSAYTPTVEINGGEITVEAGPGDTDCIDANGNLIITGGTIAVTGMSGFDIDGSVTFTGGTVIINGQQVDTIPSQQMGGRGGMMGRNFGGAPDSGGMNPGGGWRNDRGTPGSIPSSGSPDDNRPPYNRGTPGEGAENGGFPGGRGGRGRGARPDQTRIPDAATSPTQTTRQSV